MKRETYIDLIKSIGIILVLCIHTVGRFLNSGTMEINFSYGFYSFFYLAGSIGVPFFMMSTGALLLHTKRNLTLKKLYFHIIPRILFPLIGFGTCFALMELIYSRGTFQLSFIPAAFFNTLTLRSWSHLWYLYMLLGIYMLLPVFKLVADHATSQMEQYFCLILFCLGFILPLLQSLINHKFLVDIPLPLCYMGYLWFGHFIQKNPENLLLRKILRILGVLSIIILSSASIAAAFTGLSLYDNLGQYDNIFIACAAIFLFYEIRHSECSYSERFQKATAILADYSFGIYLIHPFFINLLTKVLYFKQTDYCCVIVVPLLIIFYLVFSFLATFILRKLLGTMAP